MTDRTTHRALVEAGYAPLDEYVRLYKDEPVTDFATKYPLPEGWAHDQQVLGFWIATHRDFDASYEGEEDGWVGNGLQAWGSTYEALLADIAEIERTHPNFEEPSA